MKWKTGALFGLAAALLLGGTAGSAYAAMHAYSKDYNAKLAMPDVMEVKVLENGADTSAGLLKNTFATGEEIVPGKKYDTKLSLKNDESSGMDEYVRVKVTKYWADANGDKASALDGSLIELEYGSDWTQGEASGDSVTLYYPEKLSPGEETSPFVTSLTVDGGVAKKVTQSRATQNGKTTITTTYEYDGAKVKLEVEADAVQTHNAVEAIKSVWGKTVTKSGDSLQYS